MTNPTFDALGVAPDLAGALAERGISSAFPIQALTIADALAGRDVCGKAKTGSGKTLAFGLPVLQLVKPAESRRPRAIILVPTRELATQVRDELAPVGAVRDHLQEAVIVALVGGLLRQREEDLLDLLVHRADLGRDRLGRRPVPRIPAATSRGVAGLVAQTVIDGFEAVDIHEQQRAFDLLAGMHQLDDAAKGKLKNQHGTRKSSEVAEDEETTAIPVPEKVFAAMRRCQAGIIIVSADDADRDSGGAFTINQNVLIEIGAAFVLYDRKVVLVWDKRLTVPSNLQGLYRCEFEGAEFSWTAGMKLMKAIRDFRK